MTNPPISVHTHSMNAPIKILLATLISFSAYASKTSNNPLHVAGGISSPSTSNSVHTNPAGMADAQRALVFQAGAPSILNNGIYRAGGQTGNNNFGAAAGLELADHTASSSLALYYGLAIKIPTLSFGLSGRTGLSSSANGSTFNLGAIFDLGSIARIGATAWGLQNGINEWGLGVALPLFSGIEFIADMAADSDFSGIELKPGLKVGNDNAALSISYGTGARSQFADGFTAGASFGFSGNSIEAQYNAGGSFSTYYLCFTLGM